MRPLKRIAKWIVVIAVALVILSSFGLHVMASGGDSFYSLLRIGGNPLSYLVIERSGVQNSLLYIGLPPHPTISTQAATEISMTTARLNAYLVDDKGESCYVRFQYGLTTGYGTNTSWVGGYTTGQSPSQEITSLEKNTLYHFRAQVYNSLNEGNPFSGDDLTFTTLATCGNPTNFNAIAISGTEISLSWTKGAGSYKTKIMYKVGSYPSGYLDGTEAYFDIESSYVLSGLTPGTTYYFRAWGYAPPDYWSSGYGEAIATTLAGVVPGAGVFPIPEQPGNWFTSANPSKLANMPGYGIVADVAAKLNMPLGSLFLIFGLVIAAGVGLATFIVTRSLIMLLVASGLVLLGCMIAGIVPGWVFFLYAVLGGLLGYLLTKGS